MANKIATAALQYSKRLSRFICWVWAVYRFAIVISSVIQPNAAEALASTLYMLDWIMIVNEGTYLVNSLGEKYIYSDRFILKWLDKGGFGDLISKLSKDKETEEEEGENG